jgi:hypothetical protein
VRVFGLILTLCAPAACLQEDGERCEINDDCKSGRCNPNTNTCGVPRSPDGGVVLPGDAATPPPDVAAADAPADADLPDANAPDAPPPEMGDAGGED